MKNLVTVLLTLLWRTSRSYRNQSIDLLCKSIDRFLYDRDLRHDRVKNGINYINLRFIYKNPIILSLLKTVFFLKIHHMYLPTILTYSLKLYIIWKYIFYNEDFFELTFIEHFLRNKRLWFSFIIVKRRGKTRAFV